MNKHDKRHQQQINNYAAQIDRIYRQAMTEFGLLAGNGGVILSADKVFDFDNYPKLKKQADKIIADMTNEIETVITNGIKLEWALSNDKNDILCNTALGSIKNSLSDQQLRKYYNNNEKALQAFKSRQAAGLGLSDRVWNYSNQFKSEIEMGIDLGLRDGLSAAEMSRDLRKYLKYPDKLFRRVRDEHGQLHLSKAAKAFNPGQGVYRSSYKNAMRLTRTETNMAYHTADFVRWQELDFIVGIEIQLSGNHPVVDICDELKGKYPKDFKFVGWHPQCRCHAVPITKTEKEFTEDNERILNGKDPVSYSRNSVEDVPDNFKAWQDNNKLKLETAKQLPYFIRDNEKYISQIKITDTATKGVQEAAKLNEALAQRKANFDSIINYLDKSKVEYKDVGVLAKELTDDEIINRVGGGDMTKGSCSSLALAYAGNKCGFDVLDFRDGTSRNVFSEINTIMSIAGKAGGIFAQDTNDFVKSKKLLKHVEAGKSYYFTCGKHAAIVRKAKMGCEYLELQSVSDNGFKKLNDAALKERFGAKKSHSIYGVKYETKDCIIDIELLNNSADFKKLLGYINTASDKQLKGCFGFIK